MATFASSSDGIAESEFSSRRLSVFEVAHETNSMVVSRSVTYAPGNGDLTLGGAEVEEVKSIRILEVTLDSKLTFETHLDEVVSKAARSLSVVHREEK